jgi:hypothetical protein
VQLKYKEEKQTAKSNSTKTNSKSTNSRNSSLHSLQISNVSPPSDYAEDPMASSIPLSSSSSTGSWDGESRTPFDDGASDIIQVAQGNFFTPESKQYHQIVHPFSDVKFDVSRVFIPGFGLSTNDDWPR